MDAFPNIALIGMPGVGKTTVGRAVGRRWGLPLHDVDEAIIAEHGKALSEIQDERGVEGFLEVEADAVCSLDPGGGVIAPGGSVVYSDRAMRRLVSIARVVFLDAPLAEIEARVGDLRERGVVIAPGQTLAELFEERRALYRRWAHATVDVTGLGVEEAAGAVGAAVGLPPARGL